MTLNELIGKTKSSFWDTLNRIEQSVPYEKLWIHFDNLDPLLKKRSGGTIVGIFFIFVFVIPIAPLLYSSVKRFDISQRLSLLQEMAVFNSTQNIVHRRAPKPEEWKPMNGSSFAEAEASLNQLFSDVGIDSDKLDFSNEKNEFKFSIEELNLKQATQLIFQVEGWNPNVIALKLFVKKNSKQKDLLSLEAHLAYKNIKDSDSSAGVDSGFNSSAGDNYSSDFNSSNSQGNGNNSNGSSESFSDGSRSSEGGDNDRERSNPSEDSGRIQFPPNAGEDFDSELPPPSFLEDE